MAEIRRKAAEEARRKVEQREQASLAWRSKQLPEVREAEIQSAGAVADEPVPKAFGWKQAEASEDDFPTEEECRLGVQRMISGSIYGMREGLELLGLPSEPLLFVRGKRLLLLGRDIRSTLNAIIDEWMTENKEEFRSRLKLLQEELWDVEARVRKDAEFHQIDLGAYEDSPPESEAASSGSASASDLDALEEGERPDGQSAQAIADSLDSAEGKDGSSEEPSRPRTQPSIAWTLPEINDDLYDVLGVSPDATQSEIRARFRAVVMTKHPDHGGDEEVFAKMQQAFGILTHHGKRQTYDAKRGAQSEA